MNKILKTILLFEEMTKKRVTYNKTSNKQNIKTFILEFEPKLSLNSNNNF